MNLTGGLTYRTICLTEHTSRSPLVYPSRSVHGSLAKAVRYADTPRFESEQEAHTLMQIAGNTVVQFYYTLTDDQGVQIETNSDVEPMAYLHGHGGMIPAIENALTGRSEGDKLHLTLTPDQAYGERRDGQQLRIPLKHLQGLPQGVRSWKAGMVALVKTDQGMRQVTVVKPGLKMVLVDTNHPLAGKTLTYDIEVVSVREATDEEIAHGHAHGVGGHQH